MDMVPPGYLSTYKAWLRKLLTNTMLSTALNLQEVDAALDLYRQIGSIVDAYWRETEGEEVVVDLTQDGTDRRKKRGRKDESTPRSSRPKAPKRCRIDPSTGAQIPTGVRRSGNKWVAELYYVGKQRLIGSFALMEDAGIAYQDVKKMLAEKSQGTVLYTEGDAADHFDSVVLESIKPKSTFKAPKRFRIVPSTGAPIPTGVRQSGNRWVAEISYGGKQRYIGSFVLMEDASIAYQDVKRMLAEKSQGTEGDAADHFEWAKAEATKVNAEGVLEAGIAAMSERYVCMINFLR